MKTFKIPVSYEVYGTIEVKAKTLEEAMAYAQENIDDLPLLNKPEYVEDSYKLENLEIAKSVNGVE